MCSKLNKELLASSSQPNASRVRRLSGRIGRGVGIVPSARAGQTEDIMLNNGEDGIFL